MNNQRPHWPPSGDSAIPDANPRKWAQHPQNRPQALFGAHPIPSQSEAIRIDLTMPITRVGFGIFSIDPLEQLLGQPLSQILSLLMVGPVYQRPSSTGVAVDVYPLALPPGEGASIRLGQWGEVGFKADRGLLKLIVPLTMAGWLQQRLAHVLVHGPQRGVSSDGTAYVAEVWIQLRPGMQASLPLGMFGEMGLCCG